MPSSATWSVPGSGGEPIIGNTHLPEAAPRGVVLVAHGFKGYKDYGMFPRVAQSIADAGWIAHRFNFSHSGMTDRIETFERDDLFERDTWNRQVEDIRHLINAIGDGTLAGAGLPLVLFGHSRGGVTVILAAGRMAAEDGAPALAGAMTASAPRTGNSLTDEMTAQLLRDGHLISPSSRTGQDLRLGRAFIQEQLDDPAGHDVLAQAAAITCPILVTHGADDPTVPADHADAIARAAGDRATLVQVAGGDHVFNTPNPLLETQASSGQLAEMLAAVQGFLRRVE